MVSLYNRASAPQARILRIIEGAVKSASDAHPGIKVKERHRRSIAKRAAGMVTAQWPELLSATRRSGDVCENVVPIERRAGNSLRTPAAKALGTFYLARAA